MNAQKTYTDSTLQKMNKFELIGYIRTLEHNYDVAAGFLNQQAENIKKWVIRSCDGVELGELLSDGVLSPDALQLQVQVMPDDCPCYGAKSREQELEHALLSMIIQYCQDECSKEYVTHKWMCAVETAFRVLGIEDSTPVSEIWRRIEELEGS